MAKTAERKLAIQLRKEGKTYNEIMDIIPIAKSTLSEWLKSVHLAKPQMQRRTKLRLEAGLRGAESKRKIRLAEVRSLLEDGIKKVGVISERELWLIGAALYWAEGNKQRERSVSTGVLFGNSDPQMLRVFIAWLALLDISSTDLMYELYLHTSRTSQVEEFKKWWAKQLGIHTSELTRIYYKKGSIKTNRTNTADLYHGLIRIKVKSSTSLNREVSGYIAGIVASV